MQGCHSSIQGFMYITYSQLELRYSRVVQSPNLLKDYGPGTGLLVKLQLQHMSLISHQAEYLCH